MKSLLTPANACFSAMLLAFAVSAAQAQTGSSNTLTTQQMEEQCYQAWNQSAAANSCSDPYDTPGNWGGIAVHDHMSPFECTVESACDLDSGACCYAAGFQGTKDEIKTLKNCDGELQPNSC